LKFRSLLRKFVLGILNSRSAPEIIGAHPFGLVAMPRRVVSVRSN
jgi:hypothetical protein